MDKYFNKHYLNNIQTRKDKTILEAAFLHVSSVFMFVQITIPRCWIGSKLGDEYFTFFFLLNNFYFT